MGEQKVLTRMQYEYARLAAAGHRTAEIARRMKVTAGTVGKMVGEARRRLGVDTRGLAHALEGCVVRNDPGGWTVRIKRGDPVHMTGGLYAGRVGEYDSSINGKQVYVRIGGARLALRRAHVRELSTEKTE
jgi:DNA-binding CsgD family transcriptional regulator